jgi:hypothetical protein
MMTNPKITLNPRKIALFLLAIAVFLTVSFMITQAIKFYTPETRLKWHFITMFSMGQENTIPTWYSTLLLFAAAALLALIGLSCKLEKNRFTYHWLIMSLIFLGLSVDESASLHEKLGTELSARFSIPGAIFYYTWVIPGIIFVLLFLGAYMRLLLHLPAKTRNQFLIAGIIFVTGAIGFEMAAAPYSDLRNDMGFALLITAEEFLEMLGIIVFIYSLMTYLEKRFDGFQLIFSSNPGKK